MSVHCNRTTPTLCFWYPFMNLDLVVRGPISANDWYFFCSKTLSHSDKVSLIFKASIHQIVEKIIIKPTLLSKALTSEIKFCSNPVVLNKPALIEKRGLLGSLNWYSNLAGFTHPGLLVALFKVIRSLTTIKHFNYPSVFTRPSSNVVHSCAIISPCVFFLDIRISKNRR